MDRRTRGDARTRGYSRLFWNLFFGWLRWIAGHVRGAHTALGIFFLSGAALAILATVGFAEIARHVRSGATQAFDDAVLKFVAEHRHPVVQAAMLEITALGTGTVVLLTVFVSAVFLWLTQHRHSA